MDVRPIPDPAVDVPIRSSRVFTLGLLNIRISSNLEDFSAYDYLVESEDSGAGVSFELICVDTALDAINADAISGATDQTMRATRMRTGHYNAHHFGAPAYVITRGTKTFIFGTGLERTVWPYFIKWFLTVFAVDNGFAHLKAAAVANGSGDVTLILGRGGGGKTVFLTEACTAGARFVTNTHALVKGQVLHGVPSKMRVRAREGDGAQASGLVSRHLEAGSILLDPMEAFSLPALASGPVRGIVVVNHTGRFKERVEPLAPETTRSFMQQFALAISTYGLRHDLLAASGLDLLRYGIAYDAQVEQMTALLTGIESVEVDADLLDEQVRKRTLVKLGLWS